MDSDHAIGFNRPVMKPSTNPPSFYKRMQLAGGRVFTLYSQSKAKKLIANFIITKNVKVFMKRFTKIIKCRVHQILKDLTLSLTFLDTNNIIWKYQSVTE